MLSHYVDMGENDSSWGLCLCVVGLFSFLLGFSSSISGSLHIPRMYTFNLSNWVDLSKVSVGDWMNVFPAVEGCFDSFGYHLLPWAALIDSDHPSPLTENKQVGDEYKFQARGMNTNYYY